VHALEVSVNLTPVPAAIGSTVFLLVPGMPMWWLKTPATCFDREVRRGMVAE
jgi:hypothetical protein